MLDPYDLSVGIIVFNQLVMVTIVFYAIRYFLKKRRLVKASKVGFSRELNEKGNVPTPDRSEEESEDLGINVPGMEKFTGKKKEKLKRWTGKHQINLDRDLELVENELHKTTKGLPKGSDLEDMSFPNIQKKFKQSMLDQEIESLKGKIKANKDIKSLETKKSEVKGRYQDRLASVEDKLKELDPNYVPESTVEDNTERDIEHKSYTTLKIDKELERIKLLLSESDTDTRSFLGKIKKKMLSKQEEDVEELAIKLVKKISKEVEGENIIPENELLWVEEEITKLQEDLNQK